jgi:hypothetical protein
MDAEILALAEEVASSLESQSVKSHQATLPTPITLYRTGRVLYACTNNGDSDATIIHAFDKLIHSIGEQYVRTVLLHELHVAYANLIVSFASTSSVFPDTSSLRSLMEQTPGYASKITACSSKDVIEATESLCGVYLASDTACCYCGGFESSNGSSTELDIVFASFSWVYEYCSTDASIVNTKECVLKTISKILVHGIVSPTSKVISEDEQLSYIMNIIQRIQSAGGEYSCAMGDMLQMEEKQSKSFLKTLTSRFSDGPQLQYTMAMLRGFPRSDTKPAPTKMTHSSMIRSVQEVIPKAPHQNMTDIQIGHVKSVLPDLGDGFIEEALKCYNNNVERTLDALLQMSDSSTSNIHPRLSTIPKNLPRKLKDLPEQYTANVNLHRGATAKDDGKEHAQRQKQYINEVERQAEEEAYLVENVSRALGGLRVQELKTEQDDFGITGNEYDDDYDDQYDGVGDDGGMAGGIGGMDEGLYDVDVHNVHQKYDRGGAKNEQDMWRQYNKLIKNVDAESQFWVSLIPDILCIGLP